MRFFAYLSQIANESLSTTGRFHAHGMYIFLNIAVPLIWGWCLGGAIKILGKVVRLRKGRVD